MLQKLFKFHLYLVYTRILWGRCILLPLLKWSGIKGGKRIKLLGMPIVSVCKGSEIFIGDDCVFCSVSKMTDLGVNHALVIRTLRPDASVTIGDHTGISGGSFCAAIRIEIGSECLFGANVTITDSDFHPVKPNGRRYNTNVKDIPAAPVIIEDNVFIGTGAYILKGVRIGENSVVGAGAVVTKNVPRNSIVAGNPAKVIKTLVE